VHMLGGAGRDAVDWADRALAAAGPLRHIELIAETLNTKGTSLEVLHRYDEGMALIRAAIELASAHHLSNAELRARFNLAGRLFGDDPRAALEIQRGMVEVATRTGRVDWRLMALESFAGSAEVIGLWDEALEILDQLLASDGVPPTARADAMLTRASIAAGRGDAGAFSRALVEASALVDTTGDPQRRSSWAITVMDTALTEGRLDDVDAAAADVVAENWRKIAGSLRARAALRRGDAAAAERFLDETEGDLSEGVLFEAMNGVIRAAATIMRGDRDRGLAAGTEALRRLRALDLPRFVAHADLDLIWALGPGDPATGLLVEEARAIFERLGAATLLDRLAEATHEASPTRSTAPRAGAAAERA